MEKSKIIRIFLTVIVLLVGAYYIQQSSHHTSNNQSDTVGEAKADTPAPTPTK